MEQAFTHRLICNRSDEFPQLTAEFYLQIKGNSPKPKIIIAEREPVSFLAAFIAACKAGCTIFICNPDWAKQEWQQVFDLVQPDIIWGIETPQITPKKSVGEFNSLQNHIMIPTGGSSGKIKFAIHTWETLMASVTGFANYFQVDLVNSFCLLPLYHVSGLMQFMRSFSTGGKIAIQPFKEVEYSKIYHLEPSEFFISLVPTQLQRLLQSSALTEWLSQFKTVLLGGAPAGKELLEKARYYKIPIASAYGMTETASQIATLKAEDFFQGKNSSGKVLPHAKISICNEQGKILNYNQIGNVIIEAKSLALGYYPQLNNQGYLQTDDVGFLDNENYLHIIGRSSDKILTGGENVYPAEIESAILTTEMVIDVCVIGTPDKLWGEAVTAIYIPKSSDICASKICNLLQDKISKFKIPKYWIPVETLPRNHQGKVNRQQLLKIAKVDLSYTSS